MTSEAFSNLIDQYFTASNFPLMTGRGQVIAEFILDLRRYCRDHRIALDFLVNSTKPKVDNLCPSCGDARECPACYSRYEGVE